MSQKYLTLVDFTQVSEEEIERSLEGLSNPEQEVNLDDIISEEQELPLAIGTLIVPFYMPSGTRVEEAPYFVEADLESTEPYVPTHSRVITRPLDIFEAQDMMKSRIDEGMNPDEFLQIAPTDAITVIADSFENVQYYGISRPKTVSRKITTDK